MGGIDAVRRLSWAKFERLIGEAFLDGARTYITRAELERYVQACGREAAS
jgi:hypothetical protein